MKINLKKLCLVLASACFIFSSGYALTTSLVKKDKEVYYEKHNKSEPFFETTFKDMEVDNDASLNIFYDKFEKIENDTNFMSKGQTQYANINGKTVFIDAFFRLNTEAANNPNVGVGLMLYQCIQYKIAHPEEDIKIAFSTYRLSVTAAVCVDPESKFYGYMRSIHDANYDEFGFVRIVYMLAEAARMGINVTIVGQLNAYGLKQYHPTNKNNTKWIDDISYNSYFKSALKTDCYDKYAEGKKVSDYMNFCRVEWGLDDKGAADMMHVKACAVSHYRDINGVDHGPAVWFGSTNLDGIDYRGSNGNNGTQSGVIVSDHDEIFRITYNYINLMSRYGLQEEVYELRRIITDANVNQRKLIQEGKEDLIPEDEQIVYEGSENDPIFELSFTPIGGGVDVWDVVNNPYCKYISKMAQSEDYMTFTWNNVYIDEGFFISDTLHSMVENAFLTNKNKNNLIFLLVKGFDLTALKTLKVGEDIGYAYLNKDVYNIYTHSKDIVLSYQEDGVRHYVSIMSSCNFHLGALGYQNNSLLIINETDTTGNGFYKTFGGVTTRGAIK